MISAVSPGGEADTGRAGACREREVSAPQELGFGRTIEPRIHISRRSFVIARKTAFRNPS
jgi:hypothetical protein